MKTSDTIEKLVNCFVDDLLGIVHRARNEHRAAALSTVQSMLADLRRRPGPPTYVRRGSASRSLLPPTPPAAPPPTRHVVRAVPVRRIAEVPAPVRSRERRRPAAPTGPITTELGARETLVLDAVRSLVRVTAGEIARHTALPNGTVYVLLRSLVARGRVAKTATARGVEYSLVSSGGIKPFKRVRATAPNDRGEPGAGRSVD